MEAFLLCKNFYFGYFLNIFLHLPIVKIISHLVTNQHGFYMI